MRELRAFFGLFGTISALLALAQHLGLDLWNCATCSFVNEMPLSGVIAWTGPIVLGLLTYGLFRDFTWAKIGVGLALIASLSLIAWMISNHTICLLCMLTHIGILSAGLACVPRIPLVSPPVFALAIAFTATGGWDRFAIQTGVAIFRPRDRETIPLGRVFVLFSDPECSRCHLVESQIAKLSSKPAILYRWTLLPQNMYRSVRAATLMESTRIADESLFRQLHSDLVASSPPLTDDTLVAIAGKLIPPQQVLAWLKSPPERALIAIESDQTTSQELGIKSLPALAELSAPDSSGTRTLRRIPFSEIGL